MNTPRKKKKKKKTPKLSTLQLNIDKSKEKTSKWSATKIELVSNFTVP